MPYVIAGLIVSTRDGLSPRQRPVMPSSARMSRRVEKKVVDVLASCWRVAITETGIVKSWANAAASAPNASSVLQRVSDVEASGGTYTVLREAVGARGKNFLT